MKTGIVGCTCVDGYILLAHTPPDVGILDLKYLASGVYTYTSL